MEVGSVETAQVVAAEVVAAEVAEVEVAEVVAAEVEAAEVVTAEVVTAEVVTAEVVAAVAEVEATAKVMAAEVVAAVLAGAGVHETVGTLGTMIGLGVGLAADAEEGAASAGEEEVMGEVVAISLRGGAENGEGGVLPFANVLPPTTSQTRKQSPRDVPSRIALAAVASPWSSKSRYAVRAIMLWSVGTAIFATVTFSFVQCCNRRAKQRAALAFVASTRTPDASVYLFSLGTGVTRSDACLLPAPELWACLLGSTNIAQFWIQWPGTRHNLHT